MPIDLLPDPEQNDSWNKDAGDYLPASRGDAAMAALDQAAMKTSFGLAGDFYLKNKFDKMEMQKTLSIPELNEKYNGSGITWTSPQKEITADLIAHAHKREADWANRATFGQGLTGEALNVGVGLVAGMGDPAFVAGGELIGMAAKVKGLAAGGEAIGASVGSEAAAGAGLAAEGADIAAQKSLTFGQRIKHGVIGGGVAAAAMEPFQAARDSLYQQDHAMTDSLHNIAMGMATGAALEGLKWGGSKLGEWGGGKLNDYIERRNAESLPEVQSAAAQIMDGKRPSLAPMREHAALERGGDGPRPPGSEILDYNHIPLDTNEPINKQYYVGVAGGSENLHDAADVRNSSTDFGPGLYGSDKLASENGIAASDFNEGGPGLVHQFGVEGAKLFDTEKPIDEGTANLLAENVKDQEPKLAKELAKGEINVRQFYDSAGAEGKAAMSTTLKESGYDGVHFTEEDAGQRRNGVMMFHDGEELSGKVAQTGEPMSANPAVKGGLTPQEASDHMKSYGAKENDLLHSQAEVDQNKALTERANSGAVNVEDQSYVDQEHKAAMDSVKNLADKGLLSKDGQAALDEITGKSEDPEAPSLSKLKKLGSDTMKAMANCIVEH